MFHQRETRLEIDCIQEIESDADKTSKGSDQVESTVVPPPRDPQPSTRPPRRAAAQRAKKWLQNVLRDEL